MTQRERQILRWIEEDPMITQQELAERAGITRSSADGPWAPWSPGTPTRAGCA